MRKDPFRRHELQMVQWGEETPHAGDIIAYIGGRPIRLAGGGAGPANVQTPLAITNTYSGNYTSNLTTGNSAFVQVFGYNGGGNNLVSTTSVVVSGTTLTKLVEINTPTNGTQVNYYALFGGVIAAGGSSSVVATTVNTSSNPATGMVVYEISNLGPQWDIDVNVQGSLGTGTAIDSGSGTTAHANEVVFGAVASGPGTTANPIGFGSNVIATGGFTFGYGMWDFPGSAGTSYDTTATNSSSGNWLASIVSIYSDMKLPATLPDAAEGIAYSEAATVVGGTAPYTYAITSGVIPTWASFNTSTGTVSGTPGTSQGGTTFTIQVTDNLSATASQSYTLGVRKVPALNGSTVTATATAGSITPTISTLSRTAGHYLVAFIVAANTTANNAAISSSTTGWSRLISASLGNNNAGTDFAMLDVWAKTAVGSDANPTFTQTLSGTAAMACWVVEVSNGDVSALLDQVVSWLSGSATSTVTFTSGNLTTPKQTAYGEMGAALFVQERTASSLTWSESGSGWTSQGVKPGSSSILAGQLNTKTSLSSAAAISDAGSFSTNTSARAVGLVLTLKGALNLQQTAISGSEQLKKLSLHGTVTVGASSFTSSGSLGLRRLSLHATDSENFKATGSLALRKLSEHATGSNQHTILSGSLALRKLSLHGSGSNQHTIASGSLAVRKISLHGTGSNQHTIVSGSLALRKLSLIGTGAQSKTTMTGSLGLRKLSLAGSGKNSKTTSSGSLALRKLSLQGTVQQKNASTGSIALRKLSEHGAGSNQHTIATGSEALRKLSLQGSANQRMQSSGSEGLKKLSLSGTGKQKISATGSLGLNRLSLHAGTGIQFHGVDSPALSTGSTIELTVPGTVVPGDIILIYTSNYGVSPNNISASSTGTTPVLWRRNTHTNGEYDIFKFKAGSSEAGATITLTQDHATYIGAILLAYSGPADIDAIESGDSGGIAVTSWPSPEATTIQDSDWAVFFATGVGGGGDETISYASGTARARQSDTGLAAYDSNGSVGGAGTTVGGDNWTPPAGAESFYGYTIAIRSGTNDTSTSGSLDTRPLGLHGTVSQPVRATVSLGLRKLSLHGSAGQSVRSTGSEALRKLSLSGTAKQKVSATGSLGLKRLSLHAIGSPATAITATGGIRLKPFGFGGQEGTSVSGTGQLGLRRISPNGIGSQPVTLSGTLHLKKLSENGTGGLLTHGTGHLGLKPLGPGGSGKLKFTGTGRIDLEMVALLGGAHIPTTSSGRMALRSVRLAVAGLVAAPVHAAGGLRLHPLSFLSSSFSPEGKFGDAEVYDIFTRLESHALQSGRFDTVNMHEPKNPPGNGLSMSLWLQAVRPIRTSGLDVTSALVVFNARIYSSFMQAPYDMIDPNVMSATVDLVGRLSSDFQLGAQNNVRQIDLLGSSGEELGGKAGYAEIDSKLYRVMTITIPIIINDIWNQEP